MASRPPAKVYSNRYEIRGKIARGGMADVYLAQDQLLERPVALKVLFPELSVDPSFVQRFRREAQAAANLSHPNIVPIYDWGEADDTYFIVMEYVEGKSLSSLIRSEGTLLPDRAAGIGAAVAAALAFAHRNGVIHRDVKPGNILIDANDHVKVTDFGIARAANTQEQLTQTGAVMGTATYFSPEQAQGQEVDARSDVYSLGVVLYEMITGQPPFSGENPLAVAYKHVREQPVAPQQVNPAVPAAFQAVILQAMAKEPSDRYASADELRADLLRYRQGRPVLAAPPAAVVAPPTEAMAMADDAEATRVVAPAGDGTRTIPAPSRPAAGPRPAERGRRNRTGAYVALLFLMLIALVVLLFLLGRTVGLFGGEGSRVRVPNVIGRSAEEAERTLRALGFKVDRREEPSDADLNTVFDQEPKGDVRAAKGSTVILRISQGPEQVRVPDVVGDDVDDARATLERLGLSVNVTTRSDSTQAQGRVLDQDPDPDTEVARGSTVRLTVSGGRPTPSPTARPPATAPATTTPTTALTTTTTRSSATTIPTGGGQGRGGGAAGQRARPALQP